EFQNQFRETTDKLGYEIEPGIFDTVVGLNALGINTSQSCEGHVDRGRITPWIDVVAPNEPLQFKNEEAISEKIHQEVASEMGISIEEIKNWEGEKGLEGWAEVEGRLGKIFQNQEFTPEY